MKTKIGILYAFLPVAITISLYLVFYSRIETRPGDAGFWLIVALGMSLGVALTRLFQLGKEKNKE